MVSLARFLYLCSILPEKSFHEIGVTFLLQERGGTTFILQANRVCTNQL